MAGIPKKYEKACLNIAATIIIILAGIYLVPKIIMLFMPFIVGWFLASLANPLVRFFEEKIKIKRKAGSVLVIVLVITGICFLLYIAGYHLIREIIGLLRIMPGMWQDVRIEFIAFTKRWSNVIDSMPAEVVETVENLGEMIGSRMGVLVGELGVPSIDAVGNFAENIPGLFIAVIM